MVIPLPVTLNYHILISNTINKKHNSVIMTWISKEEEEYIDTLNNKVLKLKRGDKTFDITSNQIYCYGELDFTKEEDNKAIENFKFTNHLEGVGKKIPSNYDYESHTCIAPTRRYKWTETWSPLVLVKFAHGSLGKPERIVLFNYIKK